MDEPLLLVQALVALLTVAGALAAPRIHAHLDRAVEKRQGDLAELDRTAERVRALSKRIQSELVFPQLPSLKTVDPIHDLLYVSPDLNPNAAALGELLIISQRTRALNHGPKQLLRWTFTTGERQYLVRELAAAEARFLDSYWQARRSLVASGRLARRVRTDAPPHGTVAPTMSPVVLATPGSMDGRSDRGSRD